MSAIASATCASRGSRIFSSAREQRAFGLAKRDTLPRQCRECDVLDQCHGGCPKDRFVRTADGEDGLNYLCPAFKRFYRHAAPFAAQVAAERRDAHARGTRAGRPAWRRQAAQPAPAATTRARAAAGRSTSSAACAQRRNHSGEIITPGVISTGVLHDQR